jgi:hypothetical protein
MDCCGRASTCKASLKFAILNPKNCFTVLISRVENQIDYHTCNSPILKHLPKPDSLPEAVKATKLYESVKPFPDRQSPNLSDATCKMLSGFQSTQNGTVWGINHIRRISSV